jgi:hypothetical protein
MITKFDRSLYWSVVEDCLVELHGLKRRDAHQKVSSLLKDLASPPPGIDTEIIYHAEQFDIANDLAGRQLDRAEHTAAYAQIVARHYGVLQSRPAQATVGR